MAWLVRTIEFTFISLDLIIKILNAILKDIDNWLSITFGTDRWQLFTKTEMPSSAAFIYYSSAIKLIQRYQLKTSVANLILPLLA